MAWKRPGVRVPLPPPDSNEPKVVPRQIGADVWSRMGLLTRDAAFCPRNGVQLAVTPEGE